MLRLDETELGAVVYSTARRSALRRWATACWAAACLLSTPTTTAQIADEMARSLDELSASVIAVADHLAVTAEWLRIREAAGEISAADRQRALQAAVAQVRSPAGGASPAAVRRERHAAALRLIAAAESRSPSARWPAGQSSAVYRERARIMLQDARIRLAYLSGLDASLVEAMKPAAEVLGWTQGRVGGGAIFDALDADIETVTKGVFANLPRSPGAALPPIAAAPPAVPSSPAPQLPPAPLAQVPPTTPVAAGRMFDNPQINGVAVDICETWATNCGQGGADQYCRTQGYGRALSFQRSNPGRTYVIGNQQICEGAYCTGFSQVMCVPGATPAPLPPLIVIPPSLPASPGQITQADTRCSGFTGNWNSDFGAMQLVVQGARASGNFGGPGNTIEGTVNGNVLEGRWVQPSRSGLLRFVLNPASRSFTGIWREANGSGGGYWNGMCSGPVTTVTLPPLQPPQQAGARFVGCFKDTNDFDLKGISSAARKTRRSVAWRCVKAGDLPMPACSTAKAACAATAMANMARRTTATILAPVIAIRRAAALQPTACTQPGSPLLRRPWRALA